jgi:insertion element IS1 protein InsB
MNKPSTCWFKRVGNNLFCPFCDGVSIKYGKSAAQKQRYFCKQCCKTYQDSYTRRAYSFETKTEIKSLLKESMGITSISRYLGIAKNTVLSCILKIARSIKKPPIIFGMTYEVDEQHTYVQNKEAGEIWITYAFCRETKRVVDFIIGDRTKITMRKVIDFVLLSNPAKIYTDRLVNYKSLIPKSLHCTKRRATNHIERQNLQNRIDLKRLSRNTICYSKSAVFLSACLKIYFWG